MNHEWYSKVVKPLFERHEKQNFTNLSPRELFSFYILDIQEQQNTMPKGDHHLLSFSF